MPVEIINGTGDVLYINDSFRLTVVGTFKKIIGNGTRNIYSINEMPSYADERDSTREIPYMTLLPSQSVTVLVPKEGVHEPEDVVLWVCRENLAKK